jgi:hypothetical protein
MDQAASVLYRYAALHRMRRLSRLLDARWSIPGTRWRFGLDPVLGVVPVLGAVVTLGASAYLLLEAKRIGAPGHLLGAMLGNVLIDFVAGEIPIVGDIFDFAFKAHIRNLRLLETWLARQAPAGGIPAAAPA